MTENAWLCANTRTSDARPCGAARSAASAPSRREVRKRLHKVRNFPPVARKPRIEGFSDDLRRVLSFRGHRPRNPQPASHGVGPSSAAPPRDDIAIACLGTRLCRRQAAKGRKDPIRFYQRNTFTLPLLSSSCSFSATRSWAATTVLPAGTEWVSQTLPPITQPSPMVVSPPRMVAPA